MGGTDEEKDARLDRLRIAIEQVKRHRERKYTEVRRQLLAELRKRVKAILREVRRG